MLDGGSAGAWVDCTDVLGGHKHAFALVCLFKLRVLLSIDKASWISALLNQKGCLVILLREGSNVVRLTLDAL